MACESGKIRAYPTASDLLQPDLLHCPSHTREIGSSSSEQPNLSPKLHSSCCPVAVHHGVLQGQSCLVPLGCLNARLLQWNLSWFWNQFQDPPSTQVPVLEDIWRAARRWLYQDPSTVTLVTFTKFFPSPFHGCLSYGMGSTYGGRHASRKMGLTGTMASHQHVGDKSSFQEPFKGSPFFQMPQSWCLRFPTSTGIGELALSPSGKRQSSVSS